MHSAEDQPKIGAAQSLPQYGDDLALTQAIKQIASSQRELASSVGTLVDQVRGLRKTADSIRLEVASSTLDDVFNTIQPRLMSMPETLKVLAESEASLARFGDGEFRMLLRPDIDIQFQKNSPQLRDQLLKILSTSSSDRLLVGFPPPYRGPHWSGVWADNWPSLKNILPGWGRFANAHISRPPFFEHFREEGVGMWRDVWKDKVVCVITGRGSRFELFPELFDNVKSVSSIEAPPKNAFSQIDSILDQVNKDVKTDIFLIALGPAGTVLASRIAAIGRRGLDVGHVASSYLNVVKGGVRPEDQPFIKKTQTINVDS